MSTSQPFDPGSTDPVALTGLPSGEAAPSCPRGARFFNHLRSLQIVRPDHRQGRMIAGVAAGIAHRYQIDPLAARLAFVILTMFGGYGVLLYGLGWLFLPHPDGRSHAQQVLIGTVTAGFVGGLLTVLAVTYLAVTVLLIALVIWPIVRPHHTAQPVAC